jgi:hypothetical protein
MTYRFHKSDRPVARAIATFAAALLLVSQLAGVAHFHEGSISTARAQISSDALFCPVCQLAMHSPGSVTTATTFEPGPVLDEAVFFAAPIRFESPVFSTARVRAPPVTL